MSKKRSGFSMWLLIWGLGLAGQICWNVENQWFNTFVYAKIGKDPSIITGMLIWSALASTFATFFFGTWSDRTGKRRQFIAWGYILWGVSVMAFALLARPARLAGFRAAYAQGILTGPILVVILDCVMTFFGSTANDAAFNAYVTDVTTRENRGRAESVLAILPLISMLVIFGVFDSWTQRGDWARFFLFFGGLMILTGLVSLFLVKDSDALKPRCAAARRKKESVSPWSLRMRRRMRRRPTSVIRGRSKPPASSNTWRAKRRKPNT